MQSIMVNVEDFNRDRHKYDHKNAGYEWTSDEMREAARVLAHSEVYERDGIRDYKREKSLLTFASSRTERSKIGSILHEQRLLMVEEAKNDPLWSSDKNPSIETDDELSTRLRRRKYVLAGSLFVAAVVVTIGVATSMNGGVSDDEVTFTAGVGDRNATVESLTYTTDDDSSRELTVDKQQIGERGELPRVNQNISLGKADDSAVSVEVKGEGEMICRIESIDGEVLVTESAQDHVTCTYQQEEA